MFNVSKEENVDCYYLLRPFLDVYWEGSISYQIYLSTWVSYETHDNLAMKLERDGFAEL